jgi:hypothetical protein
MESAAAREQALSARLEAVERSRIAADLAAERAAGEHDTWQQARDTELQRLEVQAEVSLRKFKWQHFLACSMCSMTVL